MRILSMTSAAAGLALALTAIVGFSQPASAGSRVSLKDCNKLGKAQQHGQRVDPKHHDAMVALVQECLHLRAEQGRKRYRENEEFAEEVLGLKNHGGGQHGKGHGGHGKKFKPGFF